ncbi:UbiH/UbiF/VisC/COQ6 family ubiquinone biosynthesis hydroxylase [Pleionea sediminis]|uniref:UbiH/UbiF/VisC/COQ6 family ubiquinone biosynthesis hydroxylase n=1 Tax=Pleionea sediminis TaxID=2569479 RepID=UPI0013DDF02C|nr:UbiH/UbiF/VisC/COQ6 family ubiquinone biosynthesis hydroxylase [Pleionea sediminis]
MAKKFDVIINGGGLVGLTFANLLSDRLKVAIVDPALMSSVSQLDESSPYMQRVSAISPRSINILESVGAWQCLPQSRISPYQYMKVWDENGSSRLSFSAQDVVAPNLGCIVENNWLRAALYDALKVSRSQFNVITSPIEFVERSEQSIRCRFEDGLQLDASLLVGAEGALSKTREWFEFSTSVHDYEQVAVVANIKTENDHELTAWQRFLETGPIAYLPLADRHMCSIVWSVTREFAENFKSVDQITQSKQIAAALDHQLGQVELVSDTECFPLIARHAEQYVQSRVALIGDAAHTIHPLAGQGVNLGFADAQSLANQVNLAAHKQRDIGATFCLRPYERERKSDNHLTQKAMTALNWIYRSKSPLTILARNFGVSCIDSMSGLKRLLANQAMGVRR